jgi:hypothetical protein
MERRKKKKKKKKKLMMTLDIMDGYLRLNNSYYKFGSSIVATVLSVCYITINYMK